LFKKKAETFHSEDKEIWGERASLAEPPLTFEEAGGFTIYENNKIGARDTRQYPID
jgi:hypothetical protein